MSVFTLQQFSITQRHSAMKVCSDSLIFGAMTPINNHRRVLDIGAGTGLLSLMCKQLGAQHVTAVELTPQAANEAIDNVARSPWSNDIEVVAQDILHYQSNEKFDLIISNPPFFDNHLKNANPLRNTARHTDTLSYATLLQRCSDLLSQDGLIYLLLPVQVVAHIAKIACSHQLCIVKQVDIIGLTGKNAKVCCLHLVRGNHPIELIKQELTIYHSPGKYSKQSEIFLRHFLLRFAGKL
ncbi:MAG: methyltransferase [Psychrobium sp.]|nr:methyltransferase [Psychrobium sp.]